jgi:hypothetical protein
MGTIATTTEILARGTEGDEDPEDEDVQFEDATSMDHQGALDSVPNDQDEKEEDCDEAETEAVLNTQMEDTEQGIQGQGNVRRYPDG